MFVRFKDLRIMADDKYEKVPLECPVCSSLMTTNDIADYNKYTCCRSCSLLLAQPNKAKWKDGWRPSKTELNRVVKNREREPIYLIRGTKC